MKAEGCFPRGFVPCWGKDLLSRDWWWKGTAKKPSEQYRKRLCWSFCLASLWLMVCPCNNQASPSDFKGRSVFAHLLTALLINDLWWQREGASRFPAANPLTLILISFGKITNRAVECWAIRSSGAGSGVKLGSADEPSSASFTWDSSLPVGNTGNRLFNSLLCHLGKNSIVYHVSASLAEHSSPYLFCHGLNQVFPALAVRIYITLHYTNHTACSHLQILSKELI